MLKRTFTFSQYSLLNTVLLIRLKLSPNELKTGNPPVSNQGCAITDAGRRHDYFIRYENIGKVDVVDVLILDVWSEMLDDSTLAINGGGTY